LAITPRPLAGRKLGKIVHVLLRRPSRGFATPRIGMKRRKTIPTRPLGDCSA
jgi:hypothetical protein